jgi:hypothetical protein
MAASRTPFVPETIQGVPGDVIARYCDGWASPVSDQNWDWLFSLAQEHWACVQHLAIDQFEHPADIAWWRKLSEKSRQQVLDQAAQELSRGPWASRQTLGLPKPHG